jgi:hypothetical protein
MSSSMQPPDDSMPIVGVKATPENAELFKLGKRMIEGSIETVQDTLRQLLTLSTALLGGSIAFMNEQLTPLGFKAVCVLFFMATVGISFYGTMPYSAGLVPNIPESVRETRDRALESKTAKLRLAGGSLLLGFAVAVLGIVWRSLPTP